ncbi:MAG: spermidine synthase [Pseudomonadota bacterium]
MTGRRPAPAERPRERPATAAGAGMRDFVIFFTGGAILALQLVASRVMTPYFGVSLYIWASILATTLLFLAIGYAVGGRATARRNRETIAYCFHMAPGLSSLWIVAACLVYPAAFRPLAIWDLILGSFAAGLILLSFPLFALSALNPILVALTPAKADAHGQRTDGGAGRVFFVSTMGSVTGVIVAAFVLIPNFTNYTSLLLLAGSLGAVGLAGLASAAELDRARKARTGAVAAAGAAGALALAAAGVVTTEVAAPRTADGLWRLVGAEPSSFGTIKVYDVEIAASPGLDRRILLVDGIVHNTMDRNGVSLSVFTHALELLGLAAVPGARRALVLGQAAGIVPMRLAQREIEVDIVDINPKMGKVAEAHFGFKPDRFRAFTEDARTFVARCRAEYDLVLVDLFQGDGVPEHLVTREFLRDVRSCLLPGGAVVMNTFFDVGHFKPQRRLLATIAEVFREVAFYADGQPPGTTSSNGYLVASARGKIDIGPVDTRSVPPQLMGRFAVALDTTQVYHARSPLLRYAAPLTDSDNSWGQLSIGFQIAYRRSVLRTFPAGSFVN